MTSSASAAAKMARARAKMRAVGLRPVQFWVPDTRLESFASDVRAQCLALKDDDAEAEVLRFAEEAAAQTQAWT